MSKVNVLLDATMLDTFLSCPAKFDYRFNKDKVTPETAKPLDRGTLVHLGKEEYYKCLQKGLPFEQAVDSMLAAIRIEGTKSDLEAGEISFILQVMEANVRFWRIADQRYEIIAIEQPFSYVLHEDELLKIIMMGKIDLLFSDNKYQNCPMDTKSFERDFGVKRLTNQFQNYAYAMNSNFLFVDRVGFQKIDTAKPIPEEKKFKRIPLSYDPLILEQWKQNVIKWVRVYYDCVVNDEWPMNLTSCDKYNRTCEYYEVCDSSGEAAKEYKLSVNFKTGEKWDPSSVLVKK
jgi:hypothetical protein